MKSIFETIAYMWLVFTMIMIPVLWKSYDGSGDAGEAYFRIENKLYYIGHLGDIE